MQQAGPRRSEGPPTEEWSLSFEAISIGVASPLALSVGWNHIPIREAIQNDEKDIRYPDLVHVELKYL